MSFAYRHKQMLAAEALLFLSILSLGGSASASSLLMDSRAEALSSQRKYLPVEDLPPKREKPSMSADEQAKLKKDLIQARDRQSEVKAKESTAPAQAKKP
jgi:hypothetical protein